MVFARMGWLLLGWDGSEVVVGGVKPLLGPFWLQNRLESIILPRNAMKPSSSSSFNCSSGFCGTGIDSKGVFSAPRGSSSSIRSSGLRVVVAAKVLPESMAQLPTRWGSATALWLSLPELGRSKKVKDLTDIKRKKLYSFWSQSFLANQAASFLNP